jgi:hypothetical protein
MPGWPGPRGHRAHPSSCPPDALAMAGLACSCLERMDFNPEMRQRIATALGTVRGKILLAQTPEGHLGNVYSTPLALQVGQAPRPPRGPPEGGPAGGQNTCPRSCATFSLSLPPVTVAEGFFP